MWGRRVARSARAALNVIRQGGRGNGGVRQEEPRSLMSCMPLVQTGDGPDPQRAAAGDGTPVACTARSSLERVDAR